MTEQEPSSKDNKAEWPRLIGQKHTNRRLHRIPDRDSDRVIVVNRLAGGKKVLSVLF